MVIGTNNCISFNIFSDGEYSTDTIEVPCNNNLDDCLKNVSNILNHTVLSGIPKSKSDVDNVCR